MAPSVNIPQPELPKRPASPPAFGSAVAAGMQQKRKAAMDQNAFGSFLGTTGQTAPNLGQKTLLGQ